MFNLANVFETWDDNCNDQKYWSTLRLRLDTSFSREVFYFVKGLSNDATVQCPLSFFSFSPPIRKIQFVQKQRRNVLLFVKVLNMESKQQLWSVCSSCRFVQRRNPFFDKICLSHHPGEPFELNPNSHSLHREQGPTYFIQLCKKTAKKECCRSVSIQTSTIVVVWYLSFSINCCITKLSKVRVQKIFTDGGFGNLTTRKPIK